MEAVYKVCAAVDPSASHRNSNIQRAEVKRSVKSNEKHPLSGLFVPFLLIFEIFFVFLPFPMNVTLKCKTVTNRMKD